MIEDAGCIATIEDDGRVRWTPPELILERSRPRMSDLYEDDILLWSERQAELLRRRAAGELVNDAELDWPNIAEEIEDVGKSQLRGVASHLVQALLHDLKAEAWPHVAGHAAPAPGGPNTAGSRPATRMRRPPGRSEGTEDRRALPARAAWPAGDD